MSFISTFDELSKLYESVEPELAEGIFDSKATKQKKYEQEITDVFKAPTVRLASEVASHVNHVVEQVSTEFSAGDEGSAETTTAKNIIRLLRGATAEARGKTPLAMVKAIISIGTKYLPNASGIDELKEFSSKVSKLSDKARQYLMEKVNTAIEKSVNHTIAFLKKEFSITESLEEATEDETIEVTEDPAEDDTIEVESRQIILECSNCGAITIKSEADVVIDEESNLANAEDACQYCEEAAGHKIVGVVAPYDVAVEEVVEDEQGVTEEEELEEILDVKLDARGFGGSGNNVSVLNGPTLEELDRAADTDKEELEELLNLDIDARGFGGKDNIVGVL